MLTFNIIIDDNQRQALVEALRNTKSAVPEYLLEMLEDLPNVEAASPGITHGLCL
jgi:hypothetical protein